MAILYSYPQISELATNDTIAISDFSNGNKTKSVTIGQLSDYFNTGVVNNLLYETTITLGYADLALLNGGTTVTTFAIPGITPTSAVAMVDVAAYLKAGTTAFDLSFNTYLQLGLGSGLNFKPRVQFLNNDNFINSSTSVYFNQGVQAMTQGLYNNPSPLGSGLSVKFDGSGGVTQGDGILTLKVLYRLIDFS